MHVQDSNVRDPCSVGSVAFNIFQIRIVQAPVVVKLILNPQIPNLQRRSREAARTTRVS